MVNLAPCFSNYIPPSFPCQVQGVDLYLLLLNVLVLVFIFFSFILDTSPFIIALAAFSRNSPKCVQQIYLLLTNPHPGRIVVDEGVVGEESTPLFRKGSPFSWKGPPFSGKDFPLFKDTSPFQENTPLFKKTLPFCRKTPPSQESCSNPLFQKTSVPPFSRKQSPFLEITLVPQISAAVVIAWST